MSNSPAAGFRDYLPVMIQIVALALGGFWVVANIQTTTAVLGEQIHTLSSSIDRLTVTVGLQGEQIQLNRADIAEMRGRLVGAKPQ